MFNKVGKVKVTSQYEPMLPEMEWIKTKHGFLDLNEIDYAEVILFLIQTLCVKAKDHISDPKSTECSMHHTISARVRWGLCIGSCELWDSSSPSSIFKNALHFPNA
jgi:hypothetical protein